jgi:hypothetical protein
MRRAGRALRALNARYRMMALPPLVLLSSLLLVACGGGGETRSEASDAVPPPRSEAADEVVEALSEAIYFEQLRDVLAEYTELYSRFQTNTFGRVGGASDPDEAAGFLAVFYSVSSELAQNVAQALELLEPPPAAEDGHRRLLAAVAARQDVANQIAIAIEVNDPSEQSRQEAQDLTAREATIALDEREACSELQEVATGSGLTISLTCP